MSKEPAKPAILSSVSNALRVLEYLAVNGEGGVSEIGRSLDLSPGTVYRLVSTLADSGLADQNPSNRKYRPGFKILEFATLMRGQLDFLDVAHGRLEELALAADETVNLGVMRGDYVVYVDRINSNRPVTVEVKVGSRVPAFCTGLGKAMLAFGEEAFQESYLERLGALGDKLHTPPDRSHLQQQLDAVRDAGFAEDDGEFSPDINCAAAPVLNSKGCAVAAVSVSGSASRFAERKSELVPLVVSASEDLGALLRRLGEDNPRL